MTAVHQAPPASTWATLYARRWDWALRGHATFLDSLSEEVRERFARGDEHGEAYVVVFGKTQVGKTTLLLDLMGLEGQALADVSKVLRGGRAHGQSATATAMEYRRSPDTFWRLQADGQTVSIDSDDKMEAELSTVRDRMERRELQIARPITVAIPCDRFTPGEHAAPAVRMLDLPGDNPKDEVEGRHVADMAQRYLPHADLILLVGKGDDLSFLRPQGLTLPGIEDWQFVPSRFHIITTYSYTAQSVLDVARQRHQSGEPIDDVFFRERLLAQIRTFLPQLDGDAAHPARYFPLEFGQSWADAQRRRPDDPLLARLVPLVTELKQALHRDIAAAVSPVARLRGAIDAHVVVGKIKARKLEQFKQSEAVLENALSQIDKRINTAKSLHQKQIRAAKEAREHHDLAVRAIADGNTITKQLVQPLLDSAQQHVDRIDDLDTRTRDLLQLMRDFRADLMRICGTDLRSASRQLPPPAGANAASLTFWHRLNPQIEQHLPEFGRIVDDAMADLHKRLSDYWIDTYFPSLSDDFKNDKESLENAIRSSARTVASRVAQAWRREADKCCKELTDRCADEKNGEAQLANVVHLLNEEKHASDQKRKALKAEHARACQAIDADMARSNHFIDTMQQAYGEELQQRRRRIVSPIASSTTDTSPPTQSAAHRFLELMAAIDLASVRRQVLLTADTRH